MQHEQRMMKKGKNIRVLWFWVVLVTSVAGCTLTGANTDVPAKGNAVGVAGDCTRRTVNLKVDGLGDSIEYLLVNCIYHERWDTLWQVKFWKKVISLSPDSIVLSVAGSRKLLAVVGSKWYNQMDPVTRSGWKDSLRKANNVGDWETVYATEGRDWFYHPAHVAPNLRNAIRIFQEENVDPFYAQSVLLIESPSALRKSSVGAYGPFQLMKSVAIRFGLRVNNYVDEREDFNKSAKASAGLFREICIPYAKSILESKGVVYSEDDLWFKLFVLHVYHAGASNVKSVVSVIPGVPSGRELLTTMWRTESRGFKNASQNYTQIVLASHIKFNTDMLFNCREVNFVNQAF